MLETRELIPVYLLWSNERQAWWKPGAWGYTEERDEAGRFVEAEATTYAIRSAQAGRIDQATVIVRQYDRKPRRDNAA